MNRINLNTNWKLISSESLDDSTNEIFSENYNTNNWYNAKVPSTVLATLVENGIYKEPYFGTNLKKIPTEQFKKTWWYRTEFNLSKEQISAIVILKIDGINYKANIWLNGKQIANDNMVNNAFRRFSLNITDKIKTGKNILLIEVIPPKPGDFTIGFVDWNPNPPDNNIGIFRDISLHFNNGVEIKNPFVESKVNLKTLNEANLIISAELVNYSSKVFKANLKGEIDDIIFSKEIVLEPYQTKIVKFEPGQFPQLIIKNPKLWWPNGIGEPNLCNLKLGVIEAENLIDETNISFGISQVEDYVNEDGHKGFKVNGHKILIRGAGWTDDLLLQDTHESLKTQIEYVKDMNLNCIRLEGFWGKDQKLYDLCDENGILVMVGWSCQWEHEEYLGKPIDPRYGGVVEPEEMELIAKAWEDQVLWLRNHPSIFVWTVGSDLLPHPDLERKYIEIFQKYDNTRSYLNSTGGIGSEQGIISSSEIISEISGSSRVKMLGPYAYTPPIYWYTDKKFGGAYGFNTETCPGANIPPIESIRKMIPEEHLWPIDEVWNYHCGKNAFANLKRTEEAIEKRYGKPSNVDDFAFKAQLLNYELMRPMFEAFQVNQPKATGIIQWMLNSSWPEMYWQLYDSFLMPNAAYYATKKANEPIHLTYNYGDDAVYIVNNTFENLSGYKAEIKILNLNGKLVLSEQFKINVQQESSALLFNLPTPQNISSVYFLDLRLSNSEGEEIGNNFYWLSTQKDVLDYEAEFEDWAFHTPSKVYADFKELNKMNKVKLDVDYNFEQNDGKNITKIIVENKNDSIAFFIELLFFSKESNEIILPVFWSDNYISLLPNEKKIVKAEFLLNEENPKLKIKGWNLA
jgi:exo-1,4-beta-D-glucosaminidase